MSEQVLAIVVAVLLAVVYLPALFLFYRDNMQLRKENDELKAKLSEGRRRKIHFEQVFTKEPTETV